MCDLIETADRVLGDGDLALVEEMGAFAASNITGFLRRLVFKSGNPRFRGAVARRSWTAQFESGQAYSKSTGPNSVQLRLVGIPGGVRPSLVAGIRGWLTNAVEPFGSELVSLESHKDTPERGEVLFHCEW